MKIGENCNIKNARIVIRGNNNVLKIGTDSTFGIGCWIVLMGDNNRVEIGNDCMIADNVDIWATDSHPIFDISKLEPTIINTSGNIKIGDHVWLGKKATVLKNTSIGNNAIVGMNSVVTKNVESSCIVVGNPSSEVRRNVSWARTHIAI